MTMNESQEPTTLHNSIIRSNLAEMKELNCARKDSTYNVEGLKKNISTKLSPKESHIKNLSTSFQKKSQFNEKLQQLPFFFDKSFTIRANED